MNNTNMGFMINADVDFLRDNCFDSYNDGVDGQITHDDGFMHINVGSTRYSFDVGQDLSNSRYNSRCNSILRDAGINHTVTGNNNY